MTEETIKNLWQEFKSKSLKNYYLKSESFCPVSRYEDFKNIIAEFERICTKENKHPALNFSSLEGCTCAECEIGIGPCLKCYSMWWNAVAI